MKGGRRFWSKWVFCNEIWVGQKSLKGNISFSCLLDLPDHPDLSIHMNYVGGSHNGCRQVGRGTPSLLSPSSPPPFEQRRSSALQAGLVGRQREPRHNRRRIRRRSTGVRSPSSVHTPRHPLASAMAMKGRNVLLFLCFGVNSKNRFPLILLLSSSLTRRTMKPKERRIFTKILEISKVKN
jgi:hypothetical protein